MAYALWQGKIILRISTYKYVYIWLELSCSLMLGQRRRRWTNIKPALGQQLAEKII